jgi:hypothetical protein
MVTVAGGVLLGEPLGLRAWPSRVRSYASRVRLFADDAKITALRRASLFEGLSRN